MSELLARTRAHIDVCAEYDGDTDRLRAALTDAGWVVSAVDAVLRVATDATAAADLNRAAASAGVTLSRLVVVQDSLEDIFLAMTGLPDSEPAAGRAAAYGEVA